MDICTFHQEQEPQDVTLSFMMAGSGQLPTPLRPCLALLMLSVEEGEGGEMKKWEGGREKKGEGRGRNDKQPPYGGHKFQHQEAEALLSSVPAPERLAADTVRT